VEEGQEEEEEEEEEEEQVVVGRPTWHVNRLSSGAAIAVDLLPDGE
jgi:hypothetical protein